MKIARNRVKVLLYAAFISLATISIHAWNLKDAAAPYKGQKIVIALPTWKNGVEAAAKDFTAQTGISVEVVVLPFDDLYEKALMDAKLGTGNYDVVAVESTWTGAFYGGGAIYPSETFFKNAKLADPSYDNSDFMNLNRYAIWNGKQYGFGFYASSHLLFYRDDLFSNPSYKQQFKAKYGYELKAPEDWGQYRDIAEFFNTVDWKTPSGEKGSGIVIMAKRGPDAWTLFLDRFAGMMKLEQNKTLNLIDNNYNVTFNNEVGYQAMQAFIDAVKFAGKGALQVDHSESRRIFMQGDAAMVEQWHTFVQPVNDPKQSKVAGKVKIAFIPGKRPCIGGWGLGISNASKHKEAAFLFAQFISNKENDLRIYLSDGKFPGRKSTLSTPEFSKIFSGDLSVLSESIENASFTPNLPETSVLRVPFELECSKALSGDEDAKSAVIAIDRAWQNILKKYK